MKKTDAAASLSLDLSHVDARHRATAWREWMRSSFPEFSLGRVDFPADGGARVMSVGDARLWLINCPPGTIRRTPDPNTPRDAFVLVQLEGTGTIAREGRVFHINKGQVCIGRVAPAGAEMSCTVPTSFLLLEIPSSWLMTRYPQFEALSFHICARDQPGAALLRDLLLGALSVGERLAEHERRATLAAAVELLILPFAGVCHRDPCVLRVERALAEVDQRLGDPRLNAEALAREQSMSRRRLDELFVSALGSPVAACITERRLLRAAELLRDPTQDKLSVTLIARRVGFQDASHFSRVFRNRFGAAPKMWRAGARTPAK